MKVFLSWSGEDSRLLAEALHDWLPRVLQAVRPWLSATDIESGARWSADIARELQENGFGILCLTQENLEAPWIMFEAGALSKLIATSRVCPFLLGATTSDLKGPLVQFQAIEASREGTLRLLESLNRAQSENVLSDRQLEETFEVWWPRFEASLASVSARVAAVPHPRRQQAEILEELLELGRAQERRALRLEQREAARAAQQRERLQELAARRALRREMEADLETIARDGIQALTSHGPSGGALDFEVGERVSHRRFGRGQVIKAWGVGSDKKVGVLFDEHGEKALLVAFAGLTRVTESGEVA